MRLAIMQPYFLPYIGYWQLINSVDTFVVYDNIQFTKSGWFNRNNILQNGKKELFSIPIKKDSDTLDVVDRVLATNAKKQIDKIISKIENNYKKAPYFKEVFPLIKDIFLYQDVNLFNYIYYSINQICSYLNINTKIIISSEITMDHSLKAQEKVIEINKKLHSHTYINSIGGMSLYDSDDFIKENILLKFLHSDVEKYLQFHNEFVEYLSIIDILMFNNVDDIILMLNQYHLINSEVQNV